MLPKVSQILLQKILLLSAVEKKFVKIVIIERVGVFFGQSQIFHTFPQRLSPSFIKTIIILRRIIVITEVALLFRGIIVD